MLTPPVMNEILFECYGAPSVAYGIDSLFAYRYNKGTDGLIVSSSHTSTHVIPVLDSKPLLSNCSRLNWGGLNNAEYLAKLMKLKYPSFPVRMTDNQMEDLVHKHCYVSQDYDRELGGYLDWTGLEDRDHVIQYPFTEHIIPEKSEEELARIAERKKESGRRLQEQAAKMRLEKLVKKEQELEYWKDLQQRLASETKKEIRRVLEAEDLKDEVQLDRMIRELEKSIKRSRNRDLGIEEIEEQPEEMTFPMLDIPDEELDEAGLKEKRHQRLMKSNVEARARAKAEKEREKARREEEERLDREKRENQFEDWVAERRSNRQVSLPQIPSASSNGSLVHSSTDERARPYEGRSRQPQIPRKSDAYEDTRQFGRGRSEEAASRRRRRRLRCQRRGLGRLPYCGYRGAERRRRGRGSRWNARYGRAGATPVRSRLYREPHVGRSVRLDEESCPCIPARTMAL